MKRSYGTRRNPEGHEDFTHFARRVYHQDPSDMDDQTFEQAEAEWITKLKG